MRYLIILSLLTTALAHSQFKEQRIRIAVVDTGLNVTDGIKPYLCTEGHYSVYDANAFNDSWGHGTNVAGLIAKYINPKTHCLQIIKYCKAKCTDSPLIAYIQALRYAVGTHPDFINLSLEGSSEDVSEYAQIKKALDRGTKVAVAAGNGHHDLNKNCNVYPACYTYNDKNFHVVGSLEGYDKTHFFSNYGDIVRFHENGAEQGTPKMSGSSQSTAIHTGKWASGQLH